MTMIMYLQYQVLHVGFIIDSALNKDEMQPRLQAACPLDCIEYKIVYGDPCHNWYYVSFSGGGEEGIFSFSLLKKLLAKPDPSKIFQKFQT